MNHIGRSVILKVIVIVLAIFLSVLIYQGTAFSYDTHIAHPNIAQMAAILANEDLAKKLGVEEISAIISGAEAEDAPTRWLNHFYDPTRNIGLSGIFLTSKQWAVSPAEQINYALGDKTWQRAIDDWKNGDRELALRELGHVVHLITDLYVPAHTRDDIHPLGDPYEQFVKYNWQMLYPDVRNNQAIINIDSLDSAFDIAANYSNNNFYSGDTIKDGNFELPIISNKIVRIAAGNGDIRLYVTNSRVGNILYLMSVQDKDWRGKIIKVQDTFLQPFDNYVQINSAHHLLPKAVGMSAGVIKLFFSEVEKDTEIALPKSRINALGRLNSLLGPVVSAAEDALNYSKTKLGLNKKIALSQNSAELAALNDEAPHDSDADITDLSIAVVTPAEKINTPPVPRPVVQQLSPVVPAVKPLVPVSIPESVNQLPASQIEPLDGTGGFPAQIPVSQPSTGSPVPPTTGDDVSSTSTLALPVLATPVLDSSFAGDVYTSSTVMDIFGANSAETVNILITSSSAEITAGTASDNATPSSTSWVYSATLLYGHNYYIFSAENSASATSSWSAPAHIVSDTQAPPVPTISVIQVPFTSDLAVTLTGVDDLTLTYYDLYYKISTTTTSTVWSAMALDSSATEFSLAGEYQQSYIFRARARDSANNFSDWSDAAVSSTVFSVDWNKKVVINEVAWAGTRNDSSGRADEWIELYNNTDEEINLKNWALDVSGRFITFATDTYIAARDYYLLERTDDETVKYIAADYIFTLVNGLRNTGERLRLYDSASTTIDEADASRGWFAGSAAEPFLSMERVSPTSTGSASTSWRSASGPSRIGFPYDGRFTKTSLIYGSPREANSVDLVEMKGEQSADEVILSPGGGAYFLNYYKVPVGKSLIMEAGTSVYLPTYGTLEIKGTLRVNGGADNAVNFNPVPSTTMWGPLILDHGAAEINGARFSRGNLESSVRYNGGIYAVSSTLNCSDCVIWNFRPPGNSLRLLDSTVSLRDTVIGADNKYTPSPFSDTNTKGIYARGGDITIDNLRLENLNQGLNGGSWADSVPALTILNTPDANFINVDYPWTPPDWPDRSATST